ncbi:MAG: ribonuclease catalytic domain-containing protein [Deltaproteobacteria bacterium]|nr:ribonuclease catalytic domain-containing protein [Deltaproteobacteria bacterium]MDL1961095.1 ribonuclease catalytic domain-containing protein [Deltaproteobacteria bacterium]
MKISTSQVVEFLEDQRFICAQCIAKKGARYHLLTHLGREINLASSRFIHVSTRQLSAKARDIRIKKLYEIFARREALKEKINIPELWELVQDEQALWSPAKLAELAFEQTVEPDHEAAFIRAVIDDHTYFKFREGMIKVQSPEAVKRILDQRAREAERFAQLIRGSQWLEKLWSDNPLKKEKAVKELDDPDISFWISNIKDFCIHGDESEQAVLVRELFRQAGLSSATAPFFTLIKAEIWDEEENLELFRYEIDTEFSKAIIQQAEALAEFSVDAIKEDREDLTGLHTFTIDGPESLDLDDALSFREVNNEWEIGIHITDIGLQIERDTPLFKDAIQRGTTIYLPDRKISMLPEILSQGAWSLEMGKDRRALSSFIYLDQKGNILSQRIVHSVINVHERLTYDDAEARIVEGHPFHTLYELCVARQTRRIEDGALPLPIPELVIQIDEAGDVEVELSQPGPARFLIAECMILANLIAAQFLKNHAIPALYRSQPPPRDRIISGNETDLLANFRQRRLISKGNLGTEPDIHHGLGLDVYTTITSPLRRGLDLLMQQQITYMLAKGKPLHTKEDLIKFAIYLQQGLNAASAVRQARTRYWLLKHMEKRKDAPLDAWILDTGPHKILAVLSDYLLIVELPAIPGQRYSWDQQIKVRIKKVNARENILKMDWGH